ncbi:hypothetical protein WAI453_007005 [Rhynchosporium graminicola]
MYSHLRMCFSSNFAIKRKTKGVSGGTIILDFIQFYLKRGEALVLWNYLELLDRAPVVLHCTITDAIGDGGNLYGHAMGGVPTPSSKTALFSNLHHNLTFVVEEITWIHWLSPV